MHTVAQIIVLFGGLSKLAAHPIRLEAPGFKPLRIEHAGTGPRGLPLASVAHCYEQNGARRISAGAAKRARMPRCPGP